MALAGVLVAYLQSGVQSGVSSLSKAVFDKGPPPPFTVQATLGPPANLDYCGGVGVSDWVFARPADKIRPPTVADMSDPATLTTWATGAGGVPAGGSFLRMTISGTSQDAVVLQAMRVVVTRKPVLRGTKVHFGGQGCGGLTSNFFTATVDRQPPGPVVAMSASTGPPDFQVIPAVPFPHQVSNSEPEQLYLELDATTCTCDVYVLIDWKAPTSSGTLAIKDGDGKPFRIAASQQAAQVVFPDPQHQAWTFNSR